MRTESQKLIKHSPPRQISASGPFPFDCLLRDKKFISCCSPSDVDSRVDFSVVMLQLLGLVGLELSEEARVILLLEAVRRSVLCWVVRLAKELKKRPT